MDEANIKSERSTDLRRRAEEILQGKNEYLKELSAQDIQGIIHELRVHQIELEMQNEELRRAQKELEESRNRYSDLYDFAPAGYFIFDKNGLILEVNLTGARMLYVERSLLIKQPFYLYVTTGSRDIFYSHLRKVFRAGTRHTCEIELIDKIGNQFDARLESIAMQDSEGKINQCRTAVIDITKRKRAEEALRRAHDELEMRVRERTAELARANEALKAEIQERKRAEEELRRSNAELEQFAYVASHDLQEPLRMISGFTKLLERRYRGRLDKSADEFITYIVDGTTRMQRMIEDLLVYSRVGTRGRPFELTSMEDVFDQAVTNIMTAIEKNGATVTHDPLPTVMADATQMTQLFQNLISNGIKFRREEPPQVHISAEKKGSEWVFSVRDNGIGIAPHFMEHLFQLFQREYTATEYPGTGIGLAICKKIVERHGGRIWAESEPEKGSTFYFTIPVSE